MVFAMLSKTWLASTSSATNKELSLGLLVAMVSVLSSTPAFGAPPGFDDGVKAYNSRQYSNALARFQQVARSAPSDALNRYYMGLCYQGLNQFALAKQQYEYVYATSRDSSLRASCSRALSGLGRYQSQKSSGSVSSTQATSGKSPGNFGDALAFDPLNRGPAVKASGRLKVIEFYADWCPGCKQFEPQWDQLTSQFGSKADFSRINGDNDKSSKARYNVTGYPTFIFTDSTGKELRRVQGPSAPSIARYITELSG